LGIVLLNARVATTTYTALQGTVVGEWIFRIYYDFCFLSESWNNKHHSRIGAGNLIVKTLARVIVESTQKMVIKLAKYLIQARSVQVDSFFKFFCLPVEYDRKRQAPLLNPKKLCDCFWAAGYRSVNIIATVWSISNAHGPDIQQI